MTNDIFHLAPTPAETATGGAFTPGHWIAPFTAGYVWQVGWVEADLDQFKRDLAAGIGGPLENVDPGDEAGRTFAEILGDTLYDDIRKGREKRAYYYADRSRAQVVARLLDIVEPAYRKNSSDTFKRNPAQFWRMETSVAETVTLSNEAKAKFESDRIIWEVPVKALGSSSTAQYQYHYLALPAAVKAYADLLGWQTPTLKAVEELSGPSDEVIITEVLKGRLIGGTEDVPAAESLSWLDRVALWKSLGEDEPRAHGWTPECWTKLTGSSDDCPDEGRAKLTDSERLGAALRTMRTNWTGPTWAAVVRVPDPDPANAYGSPPRHPSIPLFVAFYRNRDEAVAAAEALGNDVDESPAAKPTTTTDGSYPAAYAGMDGALDFWHGEVKKVLAEHLPNLPAAPVLRKRQIEAWANDAGAEILSGTLVCTTEEFVTAVEQVS
jgi:hypothetical protein